jgi:hypothetical protein
MFIVAEFKHNRPKPHRGAMMVSGAGHAILRSYTNLRERLFQVAVNELYIAHCYVAY